MQSIRLYISTRSVFELEFDTENVSVTGISQLRHLYFSSFKGLYQLNAVETQWPLPPDLQMASTHPHHQLD